MANSSIKQRYAEQFVIGCLKPYLQNVNSKPNGNDNSTSCSHDLVEVLEEAFLVLITSNEQARLLFQELKNDFPQVSKVCDQNDDTENSRLR